MKKIVLFLITSLLFTVVLLSVKNSYSAFTKSVQTSLEVTTPKLEAVFLPGGEFNAKIKQLAGNNSAISTTDNTNITSIVRGNVLTITPTIDNVVSASDSSFPIYAWYDNGTLYYYTEVEYPYMNENGNGMFRQLLNLTSIDISTIDTSRSTGMNSMFWHDSTILNLDLSTFNTSNVIQMGAMFEHCTNLKNLNLSSFNTSKVEEFTNMFRYMSEIENLDLSNFNMNAATSTTGMIDGLTKLKELKTPKVYPTDTSVTIALPKTMYDSNLVGYSLLGSSTTPTSPTQTLIKEGYTVTYDANGGSVNPSTKIVRYGDNYDLPTPTRTGYQFIGWKNSSNVFISENSTVQIASNHTLTANWTANTYTVTFDYDGATGNNSTASKQVTYDSTYGSLPTPTKTGYTFEGWNGKNMLNMNEWLNSFIGAHNGTVVKGNNSITITATGNDCYTNSYMHNDDYKIIVKPNTNYTLSWNIDDETALVRNFVFINNIATSDYYYRWVEAYGVKKLQFTTTSDAKFITFRLGINEPGKTVTYFNLQLEENTDVTEYEPYYIESTTIVKESTNHVLKAMWVTTLTNNKVDYDYTGSSQEFIAPQTGTYKVELWGASGGEAGNAAGKGAYTSGNIALDKNSKLYLYVGGAGNAYTGTAGTYAGGYNGGGKVIFAQTSRKWSTGGGATDVRLVSGSWNNFDSLKSRIMVAGAGGGHGYYDSQDTSAAGSAGGLTGYDATGNYAGTTQYDYGHGLGATQTAGGWTTSVVAGDYTGTHIESTKGGFGYGGQEGAGTWGYSGGGSGYYGGGSSWHVEDGGGGSSFISGYSGCNAISSSSTENNIIHTNQPNFYDSNYVFTNGVMIDGEGCNWSSGSATNCGANQIQPDGSYAIGHSGNGYARITLISVD